MGRDLRMWFHRWVDGDTPATTDRRQRVAMVAVAAVALAGLGVALVEHNLDSPPAVAAPLTTTTTRPTTTTTTAPATEVALSTPLATPTGEIAAFDGPGGAQITTVGRWYGYPMTMPIVEDRGAWLRIMLPQRPNGSTAWVHREDVTLSTSEYRIVIRLQETRLTVYKDGFELFSAPVGIGKAATPTAPGSFFVAIKEQPGPRGYGPVVLDTSGHSEAIRSWEGSGDAITAIHGPISASSDAQIGTTGTRISNGCIRMHEADQRKLDVIPLGTPVDIIA